MVSDHPCQHETLTTGTYPHCADCGMPRPDPDLPSPGRYENEGVSMNSGVIWTIVGVLAVIALLIFIIPRLT